MNTQKDQLIALSSFENLQPVQIFKTCTDQPQFFKTNLLDSSRVIKILKDDPNAIERIFYYQYLKLCCIEQGYPQIRRQNLRIILRSPEFSYKFPADFQEIDPKLYTDKQFKSLALEFIDQLQVNTDKLDEMLQKYPIIDLIMTCLMRSLLIINKVAEENDQFVQKAYVLNTLTKIFDIQLESFGACDKLVEADVFILEQNPFQVYMIYLKKQKQPQIPKLTNKKSSKKQKNEMYKSSTNHECYEFVDYTGVGADKFQQKNLLNLNPQTQSNATLLSKSQTKEQKSNLLEPFKQLTQSKSKNLVASREQLEMFDDQSQEEAKDSEKVREKAVPSEGNQAVSKKMTKIKKEKQMMGYESEEDEPKFKIVVPSSKLQRNQRPSSTEVETQQNIRSSRESEQKSFAIAEAKKEVQIKNQKIEVNPQEQKQFSFKNQPMKPIPYYQASSKFQSPIKDLGYMNSKQYSPSNQNYANTNYSKTCNMPTYSAASAASDSGFYRYINKEDFPSIKYDHDLQYTVKKSIPSYKDLLQQPEVEKQPIKQQYQAWEKDTYNNGFYNAGYSQGYSAYNQGYSHNYAASNGFASNSPYVGPSYTTQIKLNVTKQFTNSLIMKLMPDINSDGVRRARERARAYRKALSNRHI